MSTLLFQAAKWSQNPVNKLESVKMSAALVVVLEIAHN